MAERISPRWGLGTVAGGLLLLLAATSGLARDYLDDFDGRGWSPDAEWLAFNPVNKKELFCFSMRTGRSYLLSPLGDVNLNLGGVFSAAAPSTNIPHGSAEGRTVIVPSAGRGELEVVEWAPDSKALAYSLDRQTRGIFSLAEQAATARVSTAEPLPWQSAEDGHVAFEFRAGTKDRPACYWLRVVRPDGQPIKEIAFPDPKEINHLGVLRLSSAGFLSPNRRLLLYPRRQPNGWQLFLDDLGDDKPARPLTEPIPDPHLEWKFSNDSRYLAVAEGNYTLSVGPVDDWARAEKVPLPNLAVVMNWSSDGRFLACTDKQQLYLLEVSPTGDRIVRDFSLVTEACSPTFWGWRGSRLYYADTRNEPGSVFCVDAERPGRPQPIVKPRPQWQGAPRYRSLSPDGKFMVCLMLELDGNGGLVPQLWRIKLQPGAAWEVVYSFSR